MNSRVGLLVALAIGLVGCSSAAPATPSPAAIASVSVTPSPSAVQSTTGGPVSPSTPQVIVTAIPVTPAPETPNLGTPTPTGLPATPSPSALSTATGSQAPPTTSPSSAPLILDWQRQGDPGMGSAEDIYASAASGDRVVAIGDDSDANPVIWTTTNGHDWTLGDTTFVDYGQLNDVSSNHYGFLIVGNEELNGQELPFVLRSSDGTTWEHDEYPAMADGNFTMVAAHDPIVVIAGDSNGQNGIFVSQEDGLNNTFSGVQNPNGIGTNGVEALVATSDAIWAFDPTNGTDKPIEVWKTADGGTWTDMGPIPGSAGVADLHVANGPLGWVVTGDRYGKKNQFFYGWWSADGTNWQPSSNPPFAVSDIFADDSGFIIAGKWLPQPSGCALDPAEYAGVSWTSTDGLLWHRQSDDGWQSKWIEQLRRYNRTLFGIGIDYSSPDDTGVGAIWTAKLPPLATDNGPVPSNPPSPTGGGCGP